jgi:hypothetical protein
MDVMNKTIGWLTAIVLAGALAMPMDAFAQRGGGGSGGHAASGGGGGGGHAAAGGGGARSFGGGGGGARSFGGGGRSSSRAFTSRSGGRSAHIRSVNRGSSINRSGLRTQNLRQQRSLKRQSTSTSRIRTRTNAGVQTRTLRSNGQARITTQAARQGRFASRFASRANAGAAFSANRAWRNHWRAGFVPWYGPVFWPYAYYDLFGYAFWPYGYDDGYWFNAYDDFFDGVFWGEAGPPINYGHGHARSSTSARASYASAQELCTQPGSGVTAWPFAEIERKVGLNDEQKQLLDDVRKSASDGAATFKASCPAENIFPMTPPGRLTAMTARIEATLGAVQTVKPALEKFYNSLSDEQKERFNAIGPKVPKDSAKASLAAASEAKSCKEQKPGLTNLPMERIEDTVKPTEAQQADLKGLEEATVKAVSIMQAACPDETPITPPGRLEAMEKRLQAMIEAANTVKPALESFYGSLTNEQKARFNRIGRTLAQAD